MPLLRKVYEIPRLEVYGTLGQLTKTVLDAGPHRDNPFGTLTRNFTNG